MEKKVLDWLLEGPTWLRYAVEQQLLDKNPDIAPVLKDNSIRKIIERLKSSGTGIPAIKAGKVHYTDTGKAYWDLFFLADAGLSLKDTGLENLAEEIFRFQSREGIFTIPPNVQDNYFCMSAILISSLAKMGYRDDPRIAKYIRAIINSVCYDGGWHCYDDGTGRMEIESCPMDNMNILMLLGQYQTYRQEGVLDSAINLLLKHWEQRANLHGFGVGNRFRSLQYPAVKYGILRVLDVLSLFPYAVKSPSFQGMLDFVHAKAVAGRYNAEMADAVYVEFDFGKLGEPSRWITFLINRIDKRVEELS